MVPSTPADSIARPPGVSLRERSRGPDRWSCEGELRLRLVGRLGRRPDFPGVARAAPYLGVGVSSLEAAQAIDDGRISASNRGIVRAPYSRRRAHRQGAP